jgi:putative FmdB family regulatory protein
MPLYEFRCADCGQIFDRLLPVGSEAPGCSVCGSVEVNRLISLIGGLVGSGSSGSPSSFGGGGGGCGCGGACACGRN